MLTENYETKATNEIKPAHITVRVLKPIGKYKAGALVKVQVSKTGIPLEFFWRRRISDSAIDNCLEIIKEGKEND